MEPVFLNNPSFLELDDAYRGLSNHHFLQVKSATLERIIYDMQNIGFVAIQILSFRPENSLFTITASKGKHGPCFYSGKSAEYNGKALAAVDDDNHIFLHGISKSVCDKTCRILKMDVYHELMLNHTDLNIPGTKDDADDFEQSQEKLFNQLKAIKSEESDRRNLFYPGPFRILVLSDGTIVRRGKWSSVPSRIADDLIKKEGFKDWINTNDEGPSFFHVAYMEEGVACLMEGIKPKPVAIQNHETEYSTLNSIGKKLKDRLIYLIENERKYFVLIGNEASDKLGCCPSEEVSEANSLVRSGILDALSEPVQGDTCPITLYAFKNELSSHKSGFSSQINQTFREEVYKWLSKSSRAILQLILKWILLFFVVISIVLAVKQCAQIQQNTNKKTLSEVLNLPENPHVQLVLFHNKIRCFQCNRMEQFSMEVLQNTFVKEFQSEHLRFNTIIIDDPENSSIVEQYGIFTSTLVLFSFENKVITNSRVLLETTSLYQDEKAFKAHITSELQKFRDKENE